MLASRTIVAFVSLDKCQAVGRFRTTERAIIGEAPESMSEKRLRVVEPPLAPGDQSQIEIGVCHLGATWDRSLAKLENLAEVLIRCIEITLVKGEVAQTAQHMGAVRAARWLALEDPSGREQERTLIYPDPARANFYQTNECRRDSRRFRIHGPTQLQSSFERGLGTRQLAGPLPGEPFELAEERLPGLAAVSHGRAHRIVPRLRLGNLARQAERFAGTEGEPQAGFLKARFPLNLGQRRPGSGSDLRIIA